MANGAAPPCCVRCGEYEPAGGFCRLLVTPTYENRRQLLSMPCCVQRLIAQRFRVHGEDVVHEALQVWLSPAWSADDVNRAIGGGPRDARLWLTSWPYIYLGRAGAWRVHRERAHGAVPATQGEPAEARHLDPDTVTRHAAQELAPTEVLEVTKHLATCEDGRCAAMLRNEATGLAMMRAALYEVPLESESARTFECGDALWEIFVDMANQMGCPVDKLVNEAMELQIEQWQLRRAAPTPSALSQGSEPMTHHAGAGPPHLPTPRPPPRRPGSLARGFAPPPPATPIPPTLPRPYPPPLPRVPATPPRFGAPPLGMPTPFAGARPPPAPFTGGEGPPVLFVTCGSEQVIVNKDRFIIGRGRQSSDFQIKDPNISRQHALVELVGGRFYIVDMGSTNGIEHAGQRVTRKLIADGDRYGIGDHELLFSYRPR